MLVEGEIAGRRAARFAEQTSPSKLSSEQIEQRSQDTMSPLWRTEGTSPYSLKRAVRQLAWEKVGTVRNGKVLKNALKSLVRLREDHSRAACMSKTRVYNREWLSALENRNILDVLEVIIRCAQAREESRGVHVRTDWPHQKESWTCNLVAVNASQGLQIEKRKVIQ
jgi:succinate dehydrogenase/fumarate reductase flavoprotein subunit